MPQPIPALEKYNVVQVACGARHSAALTSSGDLFTWGRGLEGQLGHSTRLRPPESKNAVAGVQLRPKAVPAFMATPKRGRPAKSVACGHNFTVVVTRAGEVWTFGEGTTGQLGIGRVARMSTPTKVMASCPASGEAFVEAAAGWGHTLARTDGGRVLSWGFNALGALGLGDRRTRYVPERVDLTSGRKGDADEIKAARIKASGNCSGALTADGWLFTWGSGGDGRLGHRDSPEQGQDSLRPRRLDRLAKATVSDFALCGTGGSALVPLRVLSIQPTSGPMEDGCRVVIGGCGFWDSPDIVVRFTPVSRGQGNVAARSAVGTYVDGSTGRDAVCSGRDRDGGGGQDECGADGIDYITCRAPSFVLPEEVYVEVSLSVGAHVHLSHVAAIVEGGFGERGRYRSTRELRIT